MNKLFKFLSIGWLVFIFFLSSLTDYDIKNLPHISDIVAHSILYFILGGLLYFSFNRHPGFKAFVISAFYAFLDEFHQSFVNGRSPDLKDFIVDIAAVLMVLLIIKIFLPAQKNP